MKEKTTKRANDIYMSNNPAIDVYPRRNSSKIYKELTKSVRKKK